MSESDLETLQILRSLMDVQYLLSVVYDNLGMENERDEAAKRHFATAELLQTMEVIVVDEEVREIWDVVSQAGAALVAR